jgi:two-component system NtrC family sensor kinase
MKKFITILFLFLSVFVKAQSDQRYIDSLHLALQNATSDTIRMDVLSQLGFFYGTINIDSSQLYLAQGLAIARRLKLKLYEAGILSTQIYMLSWSNYPKALELSLQALKIAEDPANEKNVWSLPHGHTPHIERLITLANIYFAMAQLYGNTGNPDRQKSSLLEAIHLAEIVHDSVQNMTASLNLGNIYLSRHQLDSALFIEEKALKLFSKSTGDKSSLAWVYGTIGAIYLEKENYSLSGSAYLKGLQLMQEQNNLSGVGNLCLSLSKYYKMINKPDSSLFYGYKALKAYKTYNDLGGIADAYSSLSSAYEKQHMVDSAFAYLKSGTALQDSLNSVERKNLITYQNANMEEQMRLKDLEEQEIQTRTKIKIYSMLAGIAVCLIIAFLLYRNNQNRKKANVLLEKQKGEIAEQKNNIEQTLSELRSAQAQLIQSEKMASLGELTAGIAHEIQNPLNFVNNFSDINKELLEELKEEAGKGNMNGVRSIANDLLDNEEKINHHGKRADSIVKGMLQHSRQTKGIRELTDLNALCDEYLKLSYHGLRAKDKTFNSDYKTNFNENLGKTDIVRQDLGRCLLNIFNNAFYAVNEKQKKADSNYKPIVSIQTKKTNDKIEIIIDDNGNGIPQNIISKIFQPFFTTKPTGQGTGLGLSLAYDIVTKEHNGTLNVESREGKGSVFIIQLPC